MLKRFTVVASLTICANLMVEANFWSLEHAGPLDDEVHKAMAKKGIWRVGTETPFTPYRGSQRAFDRTVEGMKNAWQNKVLMAFSTDADYYIAGPINGWRVR
jgi:imidazolonepropionase-like amidohydrolase